MAALPDFEYTVRRSERSRRVRVSVSPDKGVEVVLPKRAPAREAQRAVVELRPWIERRLREVEATRAAVAARGDVVPYLGAELRLAPEAGRNRVLRRGETLLVPADATARGEALERWYRRQARVEIEPRLQHAVAQLGTTYTKLTIRNQRTRWGSCSTSGAMSFNWRLLLAPEPVLDYVVWHEACHRIHMDHSPRFWALVAQHVPHYAEPRRWLRRHGGTLVL